MKKNLVWILLVVLLGGFYLIYTQTDWLDRLFNRKVQSEAVQQENLTVIKLFYYNPEKDKDAKGQILCSKQGLEEVQRILLRSENLIEDALKLLIKGELIQSEKNSGLTTEFPLLGLELESATLENGNLVLKFKDPNNKTIGGSCRVGVLWAQIEATAKQFPQVASVKFLPKELFQP